MLRLIVALLAIPLFSPQAFCQPPPDNWDTLKQLEPGHRVKVVDMDLKAWDGKLVTVSDEAITIREKRTGQVITLQRGRVFRVMDLQESRCRLNAAIGFAAAFLLHRAIHWEGGDPAERYLDGVIWGGIGAGVGALIPHPRPTVYRAKDKPENLGADRHS
jgi:hypothetical protein